jgi:small conductance mechanosensitive channel
MAKACHPLPFKELAAREGAMVILSSLFQRFADGRFSANLLTFYGLIVAVILAGLILRRLLNRGGSRLSALKAFRWLEKAGAEAVRRARVGLVWLVLAIVALISVGGVSYHLAGRDIRIDASDWYEQFTVAEIVELGIAAAGLLALAAVSWLVVRVIRRLRPVPETWIRRLVERPENRETLQSWFRLLERYLVAASRILAIWLAAKVMGLSELVVSSIGFLLSVITILCVARLLTLTFRTLSLPLADVGNYYLAQGPFRHYWERVVRLFPFGERCFEAAAYVSATSLCVQMLQFIAFVASFGPRIVECIGILFGTRVLIELVQVLLNEAFGFYHEERRFDPKGRTLAPLLQSVCQYVLYFGSALVMLGVLGIDTKPILAGVGIVGLAVGLGAQNLVTDLVSGFFILFESQYLVGDFVQTGDACGIVEAVGIRLTQIRDGHGKLHLIPNGQIKGVINYSKGYVNAVVDVRVPSGSDLEGVFRAMHEAGRRLRQTRQEVLDETQIHGLVELGTSEMVVRAVTKVQPGTHASMQNEYRRLLKQVFDQAQAPGQSIKAA